MLVSFIEIYEENIYDLLGDGESKCTLRQGKGNDEVFVAGMKEAHVSTLTEAFAVLEQGQKARKVMTAAGWGTRTQ